MIYITLRLPNLCNAVVLKAAAIRVWIATDSQWFNTDQCYSPTTENKQFSAEVQNALTHGQHVDCGVDFTVREGVNVWQFIWHGISL